MDRRCRPEDVRRVLLVSGFDLDTRKKLEKDVKQLGGSFIKTPEYRADTTHLIIADDAGTDSQKKCEKFLAACAAGIWILRASFVWESAKRKAWVSEWEHQWSNLPSLGPLDNLVRAASWRWFLHLGDTGHRAFHGWKVAVCFSNSTHKAGFRRILQAGGAEVAIINNTLDLKRYEDVTYIFADTEQAAILLKFHPINFGILLLHFKFVIDFLMQQNPVPDPIDYIYHEIGHPIGSAGDAPEEPLIYSPVGSPESDAKETTSFCSQLKTYQKEKKEPRSRSTRAKNVLERRVRKSGVSVEPSRRSIMVLPPSPDDDDWLPDLDKETEVPSSTVSIPDHSCMERRDRSGSLILPSPCALSPPTSHSSDSADLCRLSSPPQIVPIDSDSDSDLEIVEVIPARQPANGVRLSAPEHVLHCTPAKQIGQLNRSELRIKVNEFSAKFDRNRAKLEPATDRLEVKTKQNGSIILPCPFANLGKANSTISAMSVPTHLLDSDSDCEIVAVIPGRMPEANLLSTPVRSCPVRQDVASEDELPTLASVKRKPLAFTQRPLASPMRSQQKSSPVKRNRRATTARKRKGGLLSRPNGESSSWCQLKLLATPEKQLHLSPKIKSSPPQKFALKRKMSSSRDKLLASTSDLPSSQDRQLRQLTLDSFRMKKDPVSDMSEDEEIKVKGISSLSAPIASSESSSVNSNHHASLIRSSTAIASQPPSDEDGDMAVIVPKVPRMEAKSALLKNPGSLLDRKPPVHLATRGKGVESKSASASSQARQMQQLTLDAFQGQVKSENYEDSSEEEETELPVMSTVFSTMIQLEINNKFAFLNISRECLPNAQMMQKALTAMFQGEDGRTMQPVHRLLQEVRKLHPPSSRAAVAMYRQAFLLKLEKKEKKEEEEETWTVAEDTACRDLTLTWERSWSFLRSVIEGVLKLDPESWERRQLLLEYVVSVLQDNLRAATPRVLRKPALRERRLRELLVVTVFCRKGQTLGTGPHVKELLKLLSEALGIQSSNINRKSRLLRSLFTLVSLVVQCLALAGGGSLPALVSGTSHLAVVTELVTGLAVAAEWMVKGIEVELFRSLLCSLEPPWLGLMLAQHWLCSLDTLSQAQPLSLPDLSLHRLLEQFSSLLLKLSERRPSEDARTRSPTGYLTCNINQHAGKRKTRKNAHGETPLHTACKKGDIARVRKLLEDPAVDINAMDNFGWTPLHEACNEDKEECALALLDYVPPQGSKGLPDSSLANPALQSKNGTSALHYTAQIGNLALCKRILARGGAQLMSLKDDMGCTPLMLAPEKLRGQLREEVRMLQNENSGAAVDNFARYIILITHLITCYLKTFVWQGSHPGAQRIASATGKSTSNENPGPSCRAQSPTLQRELCHSLQMNSGLEGSHGARLSSGQEYIQRRVCMRTDRQEEDRLGQEDKSDKAILANLPEHLLKFRRHVDSLCPKLSGERRDALAAYFQPLMMLGQQVQLTFSGHLPSLPGLR